jgi:hypothetical protein
VGRGGGREEWEKGAGYVGGVTVEMSSRFCVLVLMREKDVDDVPNVYKDESFCLEVFSTICSAVRI